MTTFTMIQSGWETCVSAPWSEVLEKLVAVRQLNKLLAFMAPIGSLPC